MLYQHALAYLLGLEGVALLHAFAGEYDEAFVRARIDEVRQLLDGADVFGDGVTIPPITTVEGYRRWAETYDQPGNGLIDVEEPIVHSILDELPVGVALDAACGTGRHTAHLVGRGHRVIGVDASPAMLERARERVPAATFHEGDLHDLPLPDDHVDVAVCALALAHVPDLEAAFVELARVLKPGGHLVVSDAHGLAAGIRPPIVMPGPDGPGHLPHRNRLTGDYLRAALAAGLRVRRFDEPRPIDERAGAGLERLPVEAMLPEGPPNIWLLHHWFPAATLAAFRHQPVAQIWHFQRDPSG